MRRSSRTTADRRDDGPRLLATALADAQPYGPRHSSAHAIVARVMAVAAAFLLVSFLVVTSSRAAFTDTTDNVANVVSTGAIALTDNDAGAAMFAAAGLGPGDDVESCIDVIYTGDLDTEPIALYVPDAPTGDLAPFLDVQVEIGSGAAGFDDCTGFTADATLYTGTLSDMATNHDSYADGIETWTPTDPEETRTFRFVVTVQDDPDAQGRTTTFGFTWEVRSL